MRSLWGWAALSAAALLGGGCVREARIALPSEVAAGTERLELTGMGGWERGTFQLGATRGRFTRHARSRSDGLVVENIGGGGFSAAGPELGGTLAATCGYHESELDTGLVTVPGDRLGYGCEFERDGRRVPGGLLLAEVSHGRGPLAGRTRAGELQAAIW